MRGEMSFGEDGSTAEKGLGHWLWALTRHGARRAPARTGHGGGGCGEGLLGSGTEKGLGRGEKEKRLSGPHVLGASSYFLVSLNQTQRRGAPIPQTGMGWDYPIPPCPNTKHNLNISVTIKEINCPAAYLDYGLEGSLNNEIAPALSTLTKTLTIIVLRTSL